MNKMDSANDVSEFIKELEDRFKPQGWKVNNIDVWPVIRVNLHYELTTKMMNMTGQKSSFKQKASRILSAISSIVKRSSKPAKFLLVSDGISYVKMDSQLYERFCDPIISILEQHSATWLKWNLTGNLKGPWTYKAVSISGILDLKFILSKFNRVQLTDQIPDIKEFLTYISERTNSQVNWSMKKINKQLHQFISIKKWYLKQLKLIKPALVIVVSYYSDRGMALLKACNELSIRTADIQHGVQGEMHIAYANWQNTPLVGYNTLPNDFMVWSEVEKNVIDTWATNPFHAASVTGNLFEEEWFAKDSDIISLIDNKLKVLIEKMAAKRTVLFTLQYGLEYEGWIFEWIAATEHEFNWLIRLHPVINNEFHIRKFTRLLHQYNIRNYELILSSSLPLYGILRNINVHVTHSSTTVLEAKHFGIKSIILSEYGAEFFKKEIDDKIAYYNEMDSTIELLYNLYNTSYSERILTKDLEVENHAILSTKAYLQTYI